MKEFNLKELLESNTVVNCKTKKDAKDFLKFLHLNGFSWGGSKSLLKKSHYKEFKKDTCYRLYYDKRVTYWSKQEYKRRGYKILKLKVKAYKGEWL